METALDGSWTPQSLVAHTGSSTIPSMLGLLWLFSATPCGINLGLDIVSNLVAAELSQTFTHIILEQL